LASSAVNNEPQPMVIQEHWRRAAGGCLSAPAALSTGASEMPKPCVLSGRSRLGRVVESGALSTLVAGALGLGFLIVEATVLSARGVEGAAFVLIAVFAASTIPASLDLPSRRCAAPCCFISWTAPSTPCR
jgi:hypothetical protein